MTEKIWKVQFCFLVILFYIDAFKLEKIKIKNDKHWKVNVIKNHLKKHKSLEGIVRLVNSNNENEGNIEILHSGLWGTICDDEWDILDGQVVCRQLGFKQIRKITHNSFFGQASRKYWIDNIHCTGQESELTDCQFSNWGENDCDSSEAAGVICEKNYLDQNNTMTPMLETKLKKLKIKETYGSNLKLRLSGGSTNNEGRIEIKINDEWGVICGDGFGILEANVVCQSMGLGYSSGSVYQTNQFGGLNNTIVLSSVECIGNESKLEHCYHSRNVNCDPKETLAVVMCVPKMADLVINSNDIIQSAYLEDRQMYFLQCAMEENCLASSAYRIQNEENNWQFITRRLLRFTAKITNVGTAPFRPVIPKNLWQFHQCHMHYHSMEVFATFDIMDLNGVKVAEGHKASFCLEDNQCTNGAGPVFACANYGDQGISVNCSDIYRHNIDCQWVDITDINPGLYTFKISVNPEYKIPEMTYTNNAAVCSMYYSETYVKIYDCVIQIP